MPKKNHKMIDYHVRLSLEAHRIISHWALVLGTTKKSALEILLRHAPPPPTSPLPERKP